MAPPKILILRHGEKPADDADHDLAPRGRERAEALARLLPGSTLEPAALFATATESDGGGVRTQQTLEPLQRRLGLAEIRTPFTKKHTDELPAHILADASLAGKVVAICWDHKNIPALARAFGISGALAWDKDTFDRFWLIELGGAAPTLNELLQPIVLGNAATAHLLAEPPGPFRAFVMPEVEVVQEAAFSGAAAPADLETGDLPEASRADLQRLLDALDKDPASVVERARVAFGGDVDAATLRSRLASMLEQDDGAAEVALEGVFTKPVPLPPEFTFDGMAPEIPIQPENRKFETWGDWRGWVKNCARYAAGYPAGPATDFRWHDHPRFKSRFVYELREQGDTRVALFADFGCGLYHARYIAKRIRGGGYPYAIHLGDVYYAGREHEFKDYFRAELDPLLGTTRLFTLNGNHEMFSGSKPYYRYLEDRLAHPAGLQAQEGSYFTLRGAKHQIVAIDTDYFGPSRYPKPPLVDWMREQLQAGRAAGLTNILMSGDEPYEYGKGGTTKLLEDLRAVVVAEKLVDLWFWGNTHYCALFGRSGELPFVGSCIGHGGYPYGTQAPGKACAAPVAFLETGARFPAWTNVRQDRGNNGYVEMTLTTGGDVTLRYIDWMGRDRCLVSLARSEGGALTMGAPRVFA